MDAMFDTFKVRAEAVSAEVHRFAHNRDALDFIVQYLQDAGVSDHPDAHAVWADCPFLTTVDKQQLSARVPGLVFEVNRESSASAKVGITQLEWAIANTGTLVQDATPVDCRLASSLPLIHIALIASDRMVPDLAAAVSKIRPQKANYISFITGPSRTADIERVLTIGVHGPEKLVIVFLDEAGRDGQRSVN
jgi:L-lactate dehydrogenase complex protein LldG